VDVKVFISWSGEATRSIARVLGSWLPTVAQHVEPWMSDEEIKSGARWNEKVAEALDQCPFTGPVELGRHGESIFVGCG
jgi:hypothetical protein